MLSDEQLSRIVQDFYASALAMENRGRMRSGPIDEHLRSARRDYYDSVARRAQESLARNELADAKFVTAAMLRKHDLTDKLDPEELNQVRQALLRAGIDLARHMKARYEGDFNHRPQDQLLTLELQKFAESNQEASKGQEPDVAGPLFSASAEKFLQNQLRTKAWEKQTAKQAEKSFKLFIEVNGDLSVGSYKRSDAAKFKDIVQQLPANYRKAAGYRNLRVEEILAKQEKPGSNTAPSELLTQKTIKRHFSALSALWSSLVTEGSVTDNIFRGFKFGNTKRANEQRDMWTEAELQRLFASPLWTGCKSVNRRSEPGKLIIRDEKFWLPIIAVFSGLRQEEICQLQLEDIRQDGEIWYFDINSKPPRQLKNRNAVRKVPIHDQLLRLGLLQYIQERRGQRDNGLFPNLKPGGADGRLGHGFTKWFTRYRRDIGLYRPRLDFHSFRHSATTFLQRADVSITVIDEVVGHCARR